MTIRRRSAVERVEARLVAEGFQMPTKPGYERPIVPKDITELDDTSLMSLWAHIGEWVSYLNSRYALAVVAEKEADQDASFEDAAVLVREWGGTTKDKVTITQAKRLADPTVQRGRQDTLDGYAYRKMLETLTRNAEKDEQYVSRELTRRTGGLKSSTQSRQDRWRT